MRTYVEFAIKKFQNKMTYRLEFFMGIVNTAITIVVYLCIYKALYGNATEIEGITYSMVATSFVISLGLSNAFGFNEMFLPDKILQGNITNEFLKPVHFTLRMLSENIGEGIFKIIFQFFPAVFVTTLHTKLCPPQSIVHLLGMIGSVMLGYLILWLLSFIIQTWSFWFISVWGIITIKNVFVNILSGALLPMWFMPSILRKVLSYTPFEAIYFTPVQIYLGELNGMEILSGMLMQIVWISVLAILANIFWKKGVKKLVIQGG